MRQAENALKMDSSAQEKESISDLEFAANIRLRWIVSMPGDEDDLIFLLIAPALGKIRKLTDRECHT